MPRSYCGDVSADRGQGDDAAAVSSIAADPPVATSKGCAVSASAPTTARRSKAPDPGSRGGEPDQPTTARRSKAPDPGSRGGEPDQPTTASGFAPGTRSDSRSGAGTPGHRAQPRHRAVLPSPVWMLAQRRRRRRPTPIGRTALVRRSNADASATPSGCGRTRFPWQFLLSRGFERPGGNPIVRPFGSARIRQVPERLPEIRAAHRHSSRCAAG